jgi:hypothetical protein
MPGARGAPGGGRLLVRLLAIGLALAAVGAALAVLRNRPVSSAEHRRVHRLATALLTLQAEDGVFDPYAGETGPPEVLRTAPHALAAAALARASELGAAASVPGLEAGRDRALAVLTDRQRPGGSFGALPPAAQNPWPGVEATAAAVLAFGLARRPEDRPVLQAALVSLERTTAYAVRDGWTRALVAMALEAAAARGATAMLGKDPRRLVRVGGDGARADCTDVGLAEAIVRLVRGVGGDLPGTVVSACAVDPPTWQGERTDVSAWWMQAWIAARTAGADRVPIDAALAQALDEALADAPEGRIAEGWYADEITQTASALLAAAEGLRAP